MIVNHPGGQEIEGRRIINARDYFICKQMATVSFRKGGKTIIQNLVNISTKMPI